MSAANTGTPWARSCSASSCSVLVLPVPVAPATSPCRLSMPSGIRTGTSVSVGGVAHEAAELEGRTGRTRSRRARRRRRGSAVRPPVRGPGLSHGSNLTILCRVIFKRVGERTALPRTRADSRGWAASPPRQVRLGELVTTKDTLHLAALLDEDSTFFGDLFAHVVRVAGRRTTSRTACTGPSGPRCSSATSCTRACTSRAGGRRAAGRRTSDAGRRSRVLSSCSSSAASGAGRPVAEPLPGEDGRRQVPVDGDPGRGGRARPDPPGHGQRVQRRQPGRPGGADAWELVADEGLHPRASVGNAPAGSRGRFVRGLDTDRRDPAVRWSRASSAPHARSSADDGDRARASTWSCRQRFVGAGQGPAAVRCNAPPALRAAAEASRASRVAASQSSQLGEPAALGDVAQPLLGRLRSRRGVTTSRSSPRSSTVRARDHDSPSRISSETEAPAGSRSSPTSTPCMPRAPGDRDLQQVGGDPLQRRGLDVEVARLVPARRRRASRWRPAAASGP